MRTALSAEEAIQVNTSLAVTAGAGTGKTELLTKRYLYHLEQGLSPLSIVAVTFTDRAAAELRSRIRERARLAFPTRPDVVAEIDAAPIGTIHSLAARICREHPQEAEVPADFRILDQIDDALWSDEQLSLALDGLPPSFFTLVPYDLARTAFEAFLDDPLVAERALARGSDGWPELATTQRCAALKELLGDHAWRHADETLASLAGAPSDRLEEQRRIAVEALATLKRSENGEHGEHSEFPREPLEAIAGLSVAGGKTANWPGGRVEEIKEAIKVIRDATRDALKAGLVTLEPGPADDVLREMLPALREAFEQVNLHVAAAKSRLRGLTFADLEVHATRALTSFLVQAYYAERWKAFLVDEFQDTNPTQADILGRLVGLHATVTIVGDPKQSIYGFRRADSKVFERFRQMVLDRGGTLVTLSMSYRTHAPLVRTMNRISETLLGGAHQDLDAKRLDSPHPAPHLHAYAVDNVGSKTSVEQRRWVEARHVAVLLEQLIDNETPVHRKAEDKLDALRPGDIAILARAWDTLEKYGDALEARGIPTVLVGGGSLLDTREAKDGVALLRFLADPTDEIALAALLRGPFFAISDKVLYHVARSIPQDGSWWESLGETSIPEVGSARSLLGDLLAIRQREPPSRLLLIAARRCGYGAIIANLANAQRREADWTGFISFIRGLERGNNDVFTVARQLKRLAAAKIEVSRPPLQADNAVALLTIHGAKGLEWPVVVVPDLGRKLPTTVPRVFLDPDLGVALQLKDDDGEAARPILHIVLGEQARRREEAEARRIRYVALTRARDRIILTSSEPIKSEDRGLGQGLDNAGISVIPIPYDRSQSIPPDYPDPAKPADPDRYVIPPIESGLHDVPATGLSEYALCPKRFRFRFVDGHPGVGDGDATARRIGRLTHYALDRGVATTEALQRLDPTLAHQHIQEALDLARRFEDEPAYAFLRELSAALEVRVSLKVDGLTIDGIVDRVSASSVVDFKTDRQIRPQHHRFQLWAYAKATQRTIAHIAYLRHDVVHTFDEASLQKTDAEATDLIRELKRGRYPASPSLEACAFCPFGAICDDRVVASIEEEM